jgi:mono/diheme cytochrome c family protein
VDRRLRSTLVVGALLGATAAATLAAALLGRREPSPAPLVATADEVARGEGVFRRWCLHCHADIALPPRVRGWSPERAYAAIGRLPEITPAMPPFRGTDDERRALAVYVASLGAGTPAR